MSCERCAGLLVADLYVGCGDLKLVRCINCGSVRDPRIDMQRRAIRPRLGRQPRFTVERSDPGSAPRRTRRIGEDANSYS
ncbi:MAG: hypothetical protein KF814_13300 [Nitrospiraceae bacterium]|nr:hypothetical protein [Nitrospiraceae bacterium]